MKKKATGFQLPCCCLFCFRLGPDGHRQLSPFGKGAWRQDSSLIVAVCAPSHPLPSRKVAHQVQRHPIPLRMSDEDLDYRRHLFMWLAVSDTLILSHPTVPFFDCCNTHRITRYAKGDVFITAAPSKRLHYPALMIMQG